MGEFSIFHWLVVLAVILIFFGGKRIPEIMKGFGEGIRSFKDGISGATRDLRWGGPCGRPFYFRLGSHHAAEQAFPPKTSSRRMAFRLNWMSCTISAMALPEKREQAPALQRAPIVSKE